MIRHVVCFKLKEGASAQEAKEMLISMRGREDTALSVEVGIDELHSPRSYDLILIVTLADFDSLTRYQTQGYHAGIVKPYMHAVTQQERSVAVDYIVND